ncbi:hypothetical protein BJ508DRAFT_332918 [Ascobolus immersus RN42]|uniref:GRF-type domain-containing protein n=1 Tax=Ascobolus immersus RN42 TaxID=1160509 RepID=A0A3N4HR94_ASCIM|nr:hypothetical protein BJ508DRAFT_332918 [Ascobolus immersus RN42]
MSLPSSSRAYADEDLARSDDYYRSLEPVPVTSNNNGGVFINGTWYCDCNPDPQPAVLKTVTKKAPTRGRQFWGCPRWREANTCDFFLWKDVADLRVQEHYKKGTPYPPHPPSTPSRPSTLLPTAKPATVGKGKKAVKTSLRTRSPPRSPSPDSATQPSVESVRQLATPGATPWSGRGGPMQVMDPVRSSQDDSLSLSIRDLSISSNNRHGLTLTVGTASASACCIADGVDHGIHSGGGYVGRHLRAEHLHSLDTVYSINTQPSTAFKQKLQVMSATKSADDESNVHERRETVPSTVWDELEFPDLELPYRDTPEFYAQLSSSYISAATHEAITAHTKTLPKYQHDRD